VAQRPTPSFLLFQDPGGNWRWNFAGPGGRIVAASTVAYPKREGCVRAIRMMKQLADVPVLIRNQTAEGLPSGERDIGTARPPERTNADKQPEEVTLDLEQDQIVQ
jgi:uncharacterized protein YegP (UPF0339 family)